MNDEISNSKKLDMSMILSAGILAAGMIVSAVLISGSVFTAGEEISVNVANLSNAIGAMEVTAPSGTALAGDDTPATAPTQPNAANLQASDLDNEDKKKGSADSPVVMIEFSDFQCPFCGSFYSNTLPQIKSQYIDTGKVQLVYRDFPLSFHPEAKPGALAAECANEQGKFWEMHDKIFENQTSMGTASYKAWAAELGLNAEQFNSCYDSGKYNTEIDEDFSDGAAAGVSGTPTFFIGPRDGPVQKVVGAQAFAAFKAAIDSALE